MNESTECVHRKCSVEKLRLSTNMELLWCPYHCRKWESVNWTKCSHSTYVLCWRYQTRLFRSDRMLFIHWRGELDGTKNALDDGENDDFANGTSSAATMRPHIMSHLLINLWTAGKVGIFCLLRLEPYGFGETQNSRFLTADVVGCVARMSVLISFVVKSAQCTLDKFDLN